MKYGGLHLCRPESTVTKHFYHSFEIHSNGLWPTYLYVFSDERFDEAADKKMDDRATGQVVSDGQTQSGSIMHKIEITLRNGN
jgi:hypothetical protein